MTPVVEFTVLGEPSPQAGTKSVPTRTADGRTFFRKITEGGVNLKSWRQEVALAARAQADRWSVCYDGPIRLDVVFRFPMPKSRSKWAMAQGVLLKVGAPDLDKLMRAIGDSLKVGGLIKDDSLIVEAYLRKIEVHESWYGAQIRVSPLDQRAFIAARGVT